MKSKGKILISLIIFLIITFLSIFGVYVENKELINPRLFQYLKKINPNYQVNKNCKYCNINFYDNVKIDTLNITISPKLLKKLQVERKEIIEKYLGSDKGPDKSYYQVNLNYQNKNQEAKIKLFGWNLDHYVNYDFFSFRLKILNDGKFINLNKMNLMNPFCREYIIDYLANEVYFNSINGIKIYYTPVNVVINNKYENIYLLEEFFSKEMIITNKRDKGFFFEVENNLFKLNFPDHNELQTLYASYYELEKFYNEDINLFISKIDKEKFMRFMAISMINTCYHHAQPYNLHWFFNANNNLLEPTIREMQSWPISELENKFFNIFNTDQRHEYYSYFLNFQGKENSVIFKLFVNYYFKNELDFNLELDKIIKQIIFIYNEQLNSEEYANFVKKLGKWNSYDVSKYEDRIRSKLNVISKSFN